MNASLALALLSITMAVAAVTVSLVAFSTGHGVVGHKYTTSELQGGEVLRSATSGSVNASNSLTTLERGMEVAQGALGSRGMPHLGEWEGSTLTEHRSVKGSIQQLQMVLEAAMSDAASSKVTSLQLQSRLATLQSLPTMDVFWFQGAVHQTVGFNIVAGYGRGYCGKGTSVTEGVDVSEDDPPVETPNGELQGFLAGQSYYIFGHYDYNGAGETLFSSDIVFVDNGDPVVSYPALRGDELGGTIEFAFDYTPSDGESPTLRLRLDNVDSSNISNIHISIVKIE